ncbi:MAG: 2-C-methyl-D-erythritol 2,4-cyclodiphosphate synthase [Prevotellaceae bacterium]|jgi:2-C-methyl-D-erythritol 2,4-cyclodiphosphate synthase|nr:2-C-methyl-D-erythritol 2,4-cyclodiphosphate synthase [Prevotellaceae bacterium]
MIRIGNGFDVHRLQEGLPFRLGGLPVPFTKGCEAHSDGDVLIHAICDALLGAAALGDIGLHFPDTDEAYENIDSKVLLAKTAVLILAAGYTVNNIDTVVCLEKPKIKDYIVPMRETLAKVLTISVEQISIKATTCERLGFIGREEGVAAYAVALLQR